MTAKRSTAILSDAMGAGENTGLERGLGLKEAVALNMIEIVGIGPFVVSGIVIREMGGPQALLAWLAGAVLATLDAFVWSELGAAMPKAGGTYVFLRDANSGEVWSAGYQPTAVEPDTYEAEFADLFGKLEQFIVVEHGD